MEDQYTVHVVDDDDSFRKAITRLLTVSGFTVQSYESAASFLGSEFSKFPGCILLDVHMPCMTGLELQLILKGRGDPLPIIFLTGAGTIPMSVSAIKSGAHNFLSKPVDKEELFSIIHESFARYKNTNSGIIERKVHQERLSTLTVREREVLEHLMQGKMNKQVAYELGTAERTIKAHRRQIMEKMEANSFAELVSAITRFGK